MIVKNQRRKWCANTVSVPTGVILYMSKSCFLICCIHCHKFPHSILFKSELVRKVHCWGLDCLHLLAETQVTRQSFRAVKDTFVQWLSCSITGHVSLTTSQCDLSSWIGRFLCLSVSPLYPWIAPRPLWCFGGTHRELF